MKIKYRNGRQIQFFWALKRRAPLSNTAVADLCYSYKKTEIVKTYDANYPYILIFGNGYASTSGRTVLFILNPATGALIKRINTGGR